MVQNIDALLIVIYFMPGFVGVLAFEALAEVKKRQAQEKIGLVVLFALASMFVVGVFRNFEVVPNVDELKKNPQALTGIIRSNLIYVSIAATLIGIFAAYVANHHLLYRFASFCKITKRTGSIDPWHQVFSRHRGVWVQIVFEDGSKLIGWPKYYSEEGENREIFLASATWYFPGAVGENAEVSGVKSIDVEGDGVLVSNFSKVKALEILKGEDDGR